MVEGIVISLEMIGNYCSTILTLKWVIADLSQIYLWNL